MMKGIPLGDSDGFLTVLSRNGRKKQRREAAQDDQGERDQEDILNPPPPPQASSDMMDRVDLGALCQHLLDCVLQNSLRERCKVWLQFSSGHCVRGILDEAVGRAFLPGYEEEVLFLIFNILHQVPQISLFPSSRPQF